jgi:hypothetical protein
MNVAVEVESATDVWWINTIDGIDANGASTPSTPSPAAANGALRPLTRPVRIVERI